MSSPDTSAERTEAATPKRLLDARAKGDVPRSRELDTAFSLVVGAAALALLGPGFARSLQAAAVRLWSLPRATALDQRTLAPALLDAILDAVLLIAPFLALMFVIAFAGPALMGGLIFTSPKLDPKRLDPIKGIGRMFSLRALGELLKSIAKVVFFSGAAWLIGAASLDAFMALGRMPLAQAMDTSFAIVFRLLLALAAVMVVIAACDMPWQRFQHAKKLRMTRDEVKRERRESEGSPETRARQRGEQMRVSRGQMLLAVPGASVVITNPTHYAVALRYRDGDAEPIVVAKGADEIALRIRAIAVESGVRVFEAPPLARALFRHLRLGEAVRPELWQAVAQVLAFVIQLDAAVSRSRVASAAGEPRRPWPIPPSASQLEVPPELGDEAVE